MSILYISEYPPMAPGQVYPQEPPITTQAVSFTGTAGASAAFNSGTGLVRITPDGNCCRKFGASPTAVASTDARLGAGQVEFVQVVPGQKVSAVAAAA